jgi:hypothetical protein
MTITRLDLSGSPVCSAFMQSDARFRLLHGPFRSGKSVTCMTDVVKRAMQQKRDKSGYRRTRWATVRNTMPQLRDTTMKTWFDWFPDGGGAGWYKETGKTFFLEFADVRAEVMFRALDDAADVKNLLSLDLTGAYINESRETAREILEGLDGRIGQYPKMDDGGPTWFGMWADTNPPEEGSYLWAMMEGLDPDEPTRQKKNGWEIFRQPGGMVRCQPGEIAEVVMKNGWVLRTNKDADNIKNLIPGYYGNLAKDKSDEYVKVYIMGLYGQSKAGKPVHPLFDPDFHVAKDRLIPNKHLLLTIAADFGHTPAFALKQQDMHGRVLTLDEVVTEGMGLQRAIRERLKPLLRNKYGGYNIRVTGDPAGNTGAQTDERSCVDIFKSEGFRTVKFAYSNTPVHRTNATDFFLVRRTEMGAGYLISPQCAYLIRGMKGGYHYKISKAGITSTEVNKNIYSHICEAGQYGDMYYFKGTNEPERESERKAWLQQLNSRAGIYTRRS